jgi:hypothetical protein
MADHADVQPLLSAYALGALTDQELEVVEEHLAECAPCQEEVRAFASIASRLRRAPRSVDPPAGSLSRLMAAAQVSSPPGTGGPRQPVRLTAVHAHRRYATPAWLAAAAAALIVLAGGWLGTEMVGMYRSMEAMQVEARQAWTNAESVAEIMGRGILIGARAAETHGTEMAPTVSGMVYYLPTQEEGVLVVDGLPELPRGQCYQVWLISGEKWMNGGTFYLGADGKGIAPVKSPMPLSGVDMVRVTMEPHGGSEQPRGNRYLWARLKST